MKKLIELCTRRPIGVSIIVALFVLLGTISSFMLKLDLYPNIDFPIFIISTTYSGAGPEEIETMITRPLEEAVSAVANVKKVSSTSSHSSSLVVVECNYGTDMDFTNLKMRERIDMIKSNLPDDADDPIIFKMDPSMMPVVIWGASSPKGLAEATRLSEDKIKPMLERVPGVASVSIMGGLTREFQVLLSADKLAYYQISPTYISQALVADNINLPGGTVSQGRNDLTIRTIGQYSSVKEITTLKITLPNGTVVPLSELGQIVDGYEERTQYSRINGGESLMIIISKESDANTVQVTRDIRKVWDKVQKQYGDEVSLTNIMEQAEFIEDSLSNVVSNAFVGGILAILVLYFFLRSIRSTLIISISIPVSIIITLACIYMANLSLNLVSLGGLALGVGMLVDNSIVVLESVFRLREEGQTAFDAAVNGTSEVGAAITSSTLTTIIVFLPILFVENIAAQIFKEMAYVVTFSLVSSLVVALTVIPTISAKLLQLKGRKKKIQNSDVTGNSLGKFGEKYFSLLTWAMNHRKTVVIGALAIFVISLLPFAIGIKMEFMPNVGEKEFTIDYELPLSTNLETTDAVAKEIESRVKQIPEIDIYYASIGNSGWGFGGAGSEKGSISVVMKDGYNKPMEDLTEQVRKSLNDLPGVKISVSEASSGHGMGGSSAPIAVVISGPELNVLQNLATDISDIIKSIPETREVETSWVSGQPELQLQINREKANSYGLSANTIANTIYTAFNGSTATQIRLDGEEYDILVQLQESDRKSLSNLEKLYVQSSSGMVPLKEVVSFVNTKGPTEISREDQVRNIQVTSKFIGNDLGKISQLINDKIKKEVIFPNNYDYSMGGEVEDMNESMGALLLVFLLAIILVYMVIAVQYENLVHPLAIMFTLPLSLFGVTWSLYFTGHTLNITSMIGVIMLVGIVVNNAIVLVDYINTLRDSGLSRTEAILQACPVRLRPVLMTTLTTVLGLLPLAFGSGDGGLLNASLAVVVIGGLSFSTILTLIVIPVVYSILDEMQAWCRKHILRRFETTEYHR